jgi:hypothetical protein
MLEALYGYWRCGAQPIYIHILMLHTVAAKAEILCLHPSFDLFLVGFYPIWSLNKVRRTHLAVKKRRPQKFKKRTLLAIATVISRLCYEDSPDDETDLDT